MTNKIKQAIDGAGGGTILEAATGLSRTTIYKWPRLGFPHDGVLDEDEIIDILLKNIDISNLRRRSLGQAEVEITRQELKQASRALKRK